MSANLYALALTGSPCVPVDGLWSISVYNADGFFEANDRHAYTVNNVTGKPNDNGSVTVHFGACSDDRPNCLPIMTGGTTPRGFTDPGLRFSTAPGPFRLFSRPDKRQPTERLVVVRRTGTATFRSTELIPHGRS